jgi:GAF domain-containing protein
VLEAISRSPTELLPVLRTIAEMAARMCGNKSVAIWLPEGDGFRLRVTWGLTDEYRQIEEAVHLRPGRESIVGRVALTGQVEHIHDCLEDPDYVYKEDARVGGLRTILGVPLMRLSEVVGVITLWRYEVDPFTHKQIEMVSMFASQAVIAIENTRLFEEVQARTSELAESLEQQTATAEVLSVISRSPSRLEPVLGAIVTMAARLCDGFDATILLKRGNRLRVGAHHGAILLDFDSMDIGRGWITGRAVVDGQPVHVHDLAVAQDEFPEGYDLHRRQGHRTGLAVPLLRDGETIGAFMIRRMEVRPFSEKQIALLQTFADQAVIAIENTRLFEETKEALDRQIATASILSVISGSPTNVDPVFEAILENASQLCGSQLGAIFRYDGMLLHIAATKNWSPEAVAGSAQSWPRPPDDERASGADKRCGHP